MRTPFIVANWKMHKTRPEARAFLLACKPSVTAVEGVEMAVAPPFPLLDTVAEMVADTPIALAAQNVHPEPEGAFTGEVSPTMLAELACRYAVVGHSERRELFDEDDAFVNRKLHALVDHHLTPILCVGESLEQREANETEPVLERQLRDGLAGLSSHDVASLVVAYEPIWAIGTGRTASPEDAEAGARFAREQIAILYDDATAESVRIQYGGSVKPTNAHALMTQPSVDGALVGGASLDPEAFAQIVHETHRTLG